MKSAELRQAFLDFFAAKGHRIVASSPLVPADDPTLLFTNAGMVQFKDTFLGKEARTYNRATSSQRCVRAGGKHNDLDNVGYTARHHTFFEMLGNFSFGDYFKRDAIYFAWEFLTQVLQLPAEKLWVTIYKDDEEAADIWLNDLKVSAERFSRCGDKDNFWSMGDTGPCGPCTEIFYDHGAEIAGGPPGTPEEDGDRYIEIWNLVFMQYNRTSEGVFEPLPKPSVDTGMGLERITAVLQGVHNNYDIDLFQSLIKAASTITGVNDLSNSSLRVIADHIRACAFMLVDGVRPSNEGRGYVLRRIIRRAVRHGHQLGVEGLFFYQLVEPLVAQMGEAYPELVKEQSVVEQLLRYEEEQFRHTLAQGLKILSAEMADLTDKTLPGDLVFRLYDTYGFPVDLTADIAREHNLTIDEAAFTAAMAAQKAQSRAGNQFSHDYNSDLALSGETIFLGYDSLSASSSVSDIFVEGQAVEKLAPSQQALIVLEQTPFYAESGGQLGDTGFLRSETACFCVTDTTKQGNVWLHHGYLQQGELAKATIVQADVDAKSRGATRLNHSATHLLHAALRNILGQHVVQKGSMVGPDKLRFDFSHHQTVSTEDLQQIEQQVNQQVRANTAITTELMSIEQAKEAGAIALFGEKYGEEVRVLTMGGNYSVELCGGTHASRTGDIGLFKITQESAIAAGVRRLEALTGQQAMNWLQRQEQRFNELAQLFKTNTTDVVNKAQQLFSQLKQGEKELATVKSKLAFSNSDELLTQAQQKGEVKVLITKVDEADSKTLRETVDRLKDKLGNAVVCLATVHNGKVSLVAGVSQSQTHQVHAGKLVNIAAQQIGGKGGGRSDMAQAGGTEVEHLDSALQLAKEWVEEQLTL